MSVFDKNCQLLHANSSHFKTWCNLNILNDADALKFGKSLRGNTHLEILHLHIHADVSVDGATNIAFGLWQCNLLQFHLYNNPGPQSDATACTIIDALRQIPSLQHIVWQMGDDVHWSEPPLRYIALTSITSVLTKTKNLTTLKVSGVIVSRTGMNHLCQNSPPITTLELVNCKINNATANVFCTNWPPDSNLRCLGWQGNLLRASGARTLMQSLQHHPSLQILKLSGNQQINYPGLESIGVALPHVHLQELHLQHCVRNRTTIYYRTQQQERQQQHQNTSVYQVIYLQDEERAAEGNLHRERLETELKRSRNRAACALVDGLKNNIHLHVLHVTRNGFDAHTEDEIAFHTSYNKFRLARHHNNSLPSGMWQYILAGYQNTRIAPSLTFFLLQENPCLFQQSMH